ncbi:flagellin N-terminal helical domain-containing protein [Aeoliella mucimassa]|uniref:Flagellin n=1 Tax=Aeoliella mucimassa TaxID=2527972 RepID=A0A518ASC3_9BACT|nr:flagellin [Aeoliella mucimassa]QDU57629.1 A-type flagellin [Aeoliella mucimassa]
MTRINTNVSSLVGRNNLRQANASLSQSLTRLSTGLRINTGKDDPAGLIASENLRSDITAIEKAISNTDRANQVIATADSALGQVSSLLNDIRGLVTESANSGALSDEQIEANQLQVDSSLEALNRIAQTTTFQGRRLLDGSLDFITSSSDTDFANVSNLQIDQANLGATGSVDVDISVTTAATKAQIDVTSFPATSTAAQATADLDLTLAQTPTASSVSAGGSFAVDTALTQSTVTAGGSFAIDNDAQQSSLSAVTLANSDISFATTAAGGLDGTNGNIDVVFTNGQDGNGDVAVVTFDGSTLTIAIDDGTTQFSTIKTAVDGFVDGGNGVGAGDIIATVGTPGGVFTTGDVATFGTQSLTGGIDAATDTAATFSATNATGENFDITFASGTSGSGVVVTGDASSGYTVTIGDDYVGDLDSIATAINSGVAEVSDAAFSSNLAFDAAAGDNAAIANVVSLTGGSAAATDAPATFSATATGGENFDITFASGASGSGVVVTGDASAGYTVTIGDDYSGDLDSIATAINSGIAEVSDAAFSSNLTFDAAVGDNASIANVVSLTGGSAGSTGTLAIDITTDANTATYNGFAINVTEGGGTANTATATLNTSGSSIDINITGTVTAQAIIDAISGIDGFTASLDGTNSTSGFTAAGTNYVEASDSAPGTAPTLTGGDNGGGLANDVVFELSGTNGSEVLSFGEGTVIADVAKGINLVSDATGVSATVNGTTLELTSNAYGTSASVEVSVIDDIGALFTDARDTGTDIVANVNGVSATGDGNELSINTATLDLSATIDPAFTGTASFSITGGGALFQLGPDVVSNQQARLGIGSVNTARLGGVSGKLYQLGTGGSADLTTDTTTAASIVEEAIDQVTSLRGRLGAFQRTTLETNQNALNDTLTNLTEAESSIRDADFAEETASLTRAQILVQSGTQVLAIANQNPQNALSLLG